MAPRTSRSGDRKGNGSDLDRAGIPFARRRDLPQPSLLPYPMYRITYPSRTPGGGQVPA